MPVSHKNGCASSNAGGWEVRVRVVLLLTFLFLISFGARAAVQFDVFLGYDNIIKESEWFPILCEFRHEGDPVKAVITIQESTFGGATRYSQQVELTSIRKRVTIPVFASSSFPGSWTVKLTDPQGRELAPEFMARSRHQVRMDMNSVGAIPMGISGLPVFPLSPGRGGAERRVPVARILPDLLPDNPLALEGLDVLYLHSEKAQDLKEPQVEALLIWLQTGGHLIVGVELGSHISNLPWLQQVSPMQFAGSATLPAGKAIQPWVASLSDLLVASSGSSKNNFLEQDMILSTGRLLGGQVDLEMDGHPLVVSAPRGFGKVSLLTFSPEREPFLSWENRPAFWVKLMDVSRQVREAQTASYGKSGIDSVLASMVESRQVHKPPVGWLLLLLGVYLVVIGPLDQYWLKRINRQMLTWITFPCYVLIFSGLIYFLGFMLRAGEREWNELHLVDLSGRSSNVGYRGRSYSAIYSPATRQYDIKADRSYAMLRPEFGTMTGGGSGARARIRGKGNSFEADLNVPVWINQVFGTDWVDTGPNPVQATFSGAGENLKVTLRNQLETDLGPLYLVVNNFIHIFPRLGANETSTFEIGNSSTTVSSFVNSHTHSFQSILNERRSAFGSDQFTRTMDMQPAVVAASFLSSAPQPTLGAPSKFDLTDQLSEKRALLFAWAPDYSPMAPLNQFSAPRSRRQTLFRILLRFDQ